MVAGSYSETEFNDLSNMLICSLKMRRCLQICKLCG